MLILEITLGVLLGEILFFLATTVLLAYRTRGQKSELDQLLSRFQNADLSENAAQMRDAHAGV